MPLNIIRQDITKIECDAIVNPTNEGLIPGGGTDLAIHEAAGKELYEYCTRIGSCKMGQAVITPAFKLPCRYVIHTVGPNRFSVGRRKHLESCYINCLETALRNGCESIAFPLISSGSNGVPKDIVMKTATRVIGDFLYEHEMTVYLVVYDSDSYSISKKVFGDVKSYIDKNLIHEIDRTSSFAPSAPAPRSGFFGELKRSKEQERVSPVIENDFEDAYFGESCEEERVTFNNACPQPKRATFEDVFFSESQKNESLEDMLRNMDKGFADTLFFFIDQKGITDVECYKRSNVDKKTFSKIKCNKDYKPSKITAVSFAIGLRLSIGEANRLLATVGMCLSRSSKFDVIIEYFLKTGNYKDIFEVNEVLYKFDQSLLGV